jgi:hypothetical protein
LGIGLLVSSYFAYKRVFKGEFTMANIVSVMNMLKDFIVYKIREKVSDFLEIGKIENNNGITTVTYFKGEDKYKIIIPTKKGPRPIKNIILNSSNEELMKRITEYAGPSRDFHGIPVTPLLLGINQPIIIEYSSGVIKPCNPNEIICVTLPV